MEFHSPMKAISAEPVRQVWLRANGAVLTICVFISICWAMLQTLTSCRWRCSRTALVSLRPGMQVATIDHSMWFHRPFNINEWLLYGVESTSASSARGFRSRRDSTPRMARWLPQRFRKG
ncbi:thioesterase family protein [Klebsiella pneumoniae subsp. pneumoniae]|nr:thioesterase family protein [Klebsiella pneumoniae subsp. pneumoniae]